MFFGNKKKIECGNCGSKVSKRYSFCPHCGIHLNDEENLEDYGMLGKSDLTPLSNFPVPFTDRMFASIVGSLMKSLNKQMMDLDNTEGSPLPNGIKISIGVPQNQKIPKKTKEKKQLTEEQLEKLSRLPRAQAKTSVKRLSNKIIYELVAPGVESANDIIISKLESGYEIKAISNKKLYVNSLPINLPINSYSTDKNKVFIEFKSQQLQNNF